MSADSEAGQFTLLSKQYNSQPPFSSASPSDILHVGNLDEVVQCFLYSLHPREIRRQSPSTRCGTVKLLFLVTAPRGKPERQMKEMEHRSGTFFSAGESRIAREQQKEQHSTSSTSQTPSAPRHPETLQLRVTQRHFTCWKA